MRVYTMDWYTRADNPEMRTVAVRIYRWEVFEDPAMPDIRGQWRDRGNIVLMTGETLREWYARHVAHVGSIMDTVYFPGGLTPKEIDQLYAFKEPA